MAIHHGQEWIATVMFLYGFLEKNGKLAVGKGARIGTDIVYNLTYSATDDIIVDDIDISSPTAAYWLFDFPKNATSASTTDGPCGSELDPETINTTETTSSEVDPTSINTMQTTSGFNPTTMKTIDTTSQGFDRTRIGKIETRTPRVHPTSNSTPAPSTPGFNSTSMYISESTTSGFSKESKGPNAPTKLSPTETTRPGYNLTTISTTETSPEFNPTTRGSPEPTTPVFDLTSVSIIIKLATTTSGTTKHIETTKIPCICSCNNFTLTDDELIKKIALLKSELSVDPKLTNKYKRSLVSV